MSADNVRSWEVADGSSRVECSSLVLDQIASAARDGFRQFRHGGMEIGGLLIGHRRGDALRVAGMRPISIEYGRGAYFLLTEADHEAFRRLLEQTNREMAPRGLQVVGYYESHTRRGVSLAETDLETFSVHFAASPAVCIVLKPEKEDASLIAVYVRDRFGNVEPTNPAPNAEFQDVEDVEPEDSHIEVDASETEEPVASPAATVPVAAVVESPTYGFSLPFDRRPIPPRRSPWIYAAPILVLIVLGFIVWRAVAPSKVGQRPSLPIATPIESPVAAPATPVATPEIGKKEAAVKASPTKKRANRARSRRARSRTVTR